jgi:hypothetical protein
MSELYDIRDLIEEFEPINPISEKPFGYNGFIKHAVRFKILESAYHEKSNSRYYRLTDAYSKYGDTFTIPNTRITHQLFERSLFIRLSDIVIGKIRVMEELRKKRLDKQAKNRKFCLTDEEFTLLTEYLEQIRSKSTSSR